MPTNNTGYTSYATLTEVFIDTLIPTGVVKANSPSDPDYVPPILTTDLCPPPTRPDIVVNNLQVKIVNSSTQSIGLENFELKQLNALTPYIYLGSVGLVSLTDALLDPFLVQTEYISISFRISQLTQNRACRLLVKYKKHTDSGIITLADVVVNGGQQSLTPLLIPFASLSGINSLDIIFIDTAIVVNSVPVVTLTVPSTAASSSISATVDIVDVDDLIHNVMWTQVSGPNIAMIATPTATTTLIENLITGAYIFKCTVTDSANNLVEKTATVNATIPILGHVVLGLYNLGVADSIDWIKFYSNPIGTPILLSGITGSNVTSTNTIAAAGTYKIVIRLKVAACAGKSLTVSSTNGTRAYNLIPESDDTWVEYCFDNIPVGVNISTATAISLVALVAADPLPLYRIQFSNDTPIINPKEFVAPFGEYEKEILNKDVLISTAWDGTGIIAPTDPFIVSRLLSLKVTATSVLTSTPFPSTQQFIDIEPTISLIKVEKLWDYSLNNPVVPEDPDDLIQHTTYIQEIVATESYVF